MKSASEVLVAVVIAFSAASCRSEPKGDVHADQADPKACARCHTPEFVATKHPPHPSARPDTCGVCHTQTSWHRWRVEHPWYELTGAHLRAAQDKNLAGKENQVKCFWCHRGDPATWKDTKKECVACHEEDREDVKVPDHDTFGTECEKCHTTETWKGAKRPPRPEPAVEHDAGLAPVHDAGAAAKPVVVPKPKPTPTAAPPKPTPTPTIAPTTKPDVVTRPSRRH